MWIPKIFRRRRALIRLVSFTTAAFGIAIGFAAWGWWLAYSYKQSIEYSYQQAISELAVHVNSIDLELQKGMYAGTPTQLVGLSSQIWLDAGAAKTSLAQIPTQDTHLESTYKFLSQAGDFANTMSKDVAFSRVITAADRKTMATLASYAAKLTDQLNEMTDAMQSGRLSIFTAKQAIRKGSSAEPGGNLTVASGLQSVENSVTAMPSLIYDGPFSDNVLKKTPDYTQGRKQVDRETARRAAAGFLGVGASAVKDDGETNGNLPTYNFTKGTVTINVSKAGALVVRMLDSRAVQTDKLSGTLALQKGRSFLQRCKISSMTESYYQTNNSICVINYAYTQDDVVCYTDLIKVGVALDNGGIISFDATGYLMNHKKRTFPQAKITQDEVRKNVSPNLKIKKVSRKLIPMDDGAESLCYEFKCDGANGQTVLDYFDIQTGREDQLLILLQTPGGTLAV